MTISEEGSRQKKFLPIHSQGTEAIERRFKKSSSQWSLVSSLASRRGSSVASSASIRSSGARRDRKILDL